MQVPKQSSYVAIVSAIGSAIEYYSFITYILLSAYLGKAFFPNSDPLAAMLYTLLLFAVAYLIMPLSSLGFGFFADRIGRKKIMVIAIMLMALATFTIGLLPTYKTIGITATIALFVLRILQGLAQGAELPGAITFVSEHAEDKNQARLCGWLFFAVGSGALLSTFVNYILTSTLSQQAMFSYGWRIPFLLAGLLGIIGFLIRRYTKETPAFLKQQKIGVAEIPIITLLKEHWRKVLIGFGLVCGGSMLVNFGLALPGFLQTSFGYAAKDTYLATTFAFALDILLIIFSITADRIGLRKFYLYGVLINLICILPMFSLLLLHSKPALFAFILLYHLLILFLAACYPAMLSCLFPTKIRYSGVSLSYLGAYSIAGFTPLIVTHLYANFKNIWVVAMFLSTALLVSLISGICYRAK